MKKFRPNGVSMLANHHAIRLGISKKALSKRGSTGRKKVAAAVRKDVFNTCAGVVQELCRSDSELVQ